MDLYETRSDSVRKCAKVAHNRGYDVFAIQDGGLCFGSPDAATNYKKYGLSRNCRDGLGGVDANSVYRVIGRIANFIVATII